MKIIRSILLIIFINIFLFGSEISKNKIVRYGISPESGLLSKFKDANIAIAQWASDVGLSNSVNIDMEIYDEDKLVIDDYLEKKLDVIIVDPILFFKKEKLLESVTADKWGIVMDDSKFTQYYLLSNGNSKNLKGFGDLENKRLVINSDDKLALMWLNKNSYLKNKKHAKKLLSSLKKEKNDKRVILDLFFGKSDYAIVDKKAWDIIVNFNPTIKKKVKIIDSSENMFVQNIGLYTKYSDKKDREIFFKRGKDLSSLGIKNSNKIMSLIKAKSVYRIEKKFLDNFRDYYNNYSELEKRYN